MLPQFMPTLGDTLREYMDHYQVTEERLAVLLDMSAESVTRLLTGQMPITEDIARRLEQIFWRPAQFWMNHKTHV